MNTQIEPNLFLKLVHCEKIIFLKQKNVMH